MNALKTSTFVLALVACGMAIISDPHQARAGAGDKTEITINFPTDVPGGFGLRGNVPLNVEHFRISPECHFDNFIGGGGPSSPPALGWDCAGGLNPNYLGPNPSPGEALYFDALGGLFDLVSANIYQTGLSIISSKGGAFTQPHTVGPLFNEVNFTGPEWTDITWVAFSYYGGVGAPAAGFNQLVVGVAAPEPPPIALVLCGLMVLVLMKKGRVKPSDKCAP
jgi:hypothetical protein